MTLLRSDVFTHEQISRIYKSIDQEFQNREVVDWYDSAMGHQYPKNKLFIAIKKELLSRLDIDRLKLDDDIVESAKKCATDILYNLGINVKGVVGITYVEYNKKYGGNPYLNPHKDALGESDFVLDYQLDANTSWEIGINKDLYKLNNNDALGIITTKNYHWRANKQWNDNEYVKMLFFHIALENRNIDDAPYSKEEIWNFAKDYNGDIK